jgi:hypothetical protein
LYGTIDLGLWYSKGCNLNLISYLDVDFTGCKVDIKNTNGTCYSLGSSLLSWTNTKQNSVALSTTKVEYIASSSYCAQNL